MEYCIAAASSPFAPPNCSSSILPNRGSGVPTFTVYISFFMWWYMSPHFRWIHCISFWSDSAECLSKRLGFNEREKHRFSCVESPDFSFTPPDSIDFCAAILLGTVSEWSSTVPTDSWSILDLWHIDSSLGSFSNH